jgi:hypothetical protein
MYVIGDDARGDGFGAVPRHFRGQETSEETRLARPNHRPPIKRGPAQVDE